MEWVMQSPRASLRPPSPEAALPPPLPLPTPPAPAHRDGGKGRHHADDELTLAAPSLFYLAHRVAGMKEATMMASSSPPPPPPPYLYLHRGARGRLL